MYIDKIENLKNYVKDQDLCKAILDFIKVAKTVDTGKHVILGKTFANVLEYTTKPFTEIKMEAHRAFLDLQYIVCGEEKILKQDLADNKPVTEYDEIKDRAFYSPKTFDTALLLEGTFGIMYPEDLHQCVAVNQPMNIRKIVFKIPVGLI